MPAACALVSPAALTEGAGAAEALMALSTFGEGAATRLALRLTCEGALVVMAAIIEGDTGVALVVGLVVGADCETWGADWAGGCCEVSAAMRSPPPASKSGGSMACWMRTVP